MIEVQFKRFTGKNKIHCESCGQNIKEKQPFYKLYFKEIDTTIKICEDCGQNLQNDMSDEYHKFVDLGL